MAIHVTPLDLSFHICKTGIRMHFFFFLSLFHLGAVGRAFIPECCFSQLVCDDDLMCGGHHVCCVSKGQSRQEPSPWGSQPHWGHMMHLTELEHSHHQTHSYHTNNSTLLTMQKLYAKLLQSCPTLCDPIDSSPPGSPVPGILQARTLEWVAISFSNA